MEWYNGLFIAVLGVIGVFGALAIISLTFWLSEKLYSDSEPVKVEK